MSLFSFFHGIRIILQKGVVVEPVYLLVISFLFTILQFLLLIKEFYSIYLYIAIIIFTLIFSWKKKGKTLSIHKTTELELLQKLERLLHEKNIEYKLIQEPFEQPIIELPEENAKIKIEYHGEKEKKSRYQLTFLQWWRIYFLEEIIFELKEEYQRERVNENFWKSGMIDISFATVLLLVSVYFFSQYLQITNWIF